MAATSPHEKQKPVPLRRRRHEYLIGVAMGQRCRNPRCREYPYYGARGISVCRRWSGENGFRNFIADVGRQPFARASLHRKDNDGNYAPGNVCWADAKMQARHTRGNRVLSLGRRRMILVEWAEELTMKPGTLGARLARGWPVRKALITPVGKSHGGGRSGPKGLRGAAQGR